jgi:hypothetical protein
MIKLLAAGLAMSGTLALAADTLSATGVGVNMVVTVEARHGKIVPVVYREDVMVHQGHDRLEVTDWVSLQGEHAGIELFLMLDDSSSSRLGSYLDELRQFINSQPATTAIAVGYMRNGTVDIVQNFTVDHSRAAKALRLPFGSPGTVASPYLSLSDLIKRWPASQTPHEVLMVTNGIDGLGGIGPGNPYVDTAIDNAQRAGTIVYAIYTPGAGHYGHSSWRIFWGQNWLAKTAEETGGEAYFLGFGPPVSFAPYLTDLSERLMHQYLVTFLAKPGKKPGFQPVKLSTEAPNAELVSASKIYVPAGQ